MKATAGNGGRGTVWRRHLEFLLGGVFPLVVAWLLGQLWMNDREAAARADAERAADRTHLAFQFHADPAVAFREWADRFEGAVARGAYAETAAGTDLPAAPGHLAVQAVVFTAEGRPWAPPGIRLAPKMVVGRFWRDLSQGAAPDRNYTLYRSLLGSGLPPMNFLLAGEAGRLVSFENEPGVETWLYFRRGTGQSGFLAFVRGPVEEWGGAVEAGRRLASGAAWVVRDPVSGRVAVLGGAAGAAAAADPVGIEAPGRPVSPVGSATTSTGGSPVGPVGLVGSETVTESGFPVAPAASGDVGTRQVAGAKAGQAPVNPGIGKSVVDLGGRMGVVDLAGLPRPGLEGPPAGGRFVRGWKMPGGVEVWQILPVLDWFATGRRVVAVVAGMGLLLLLGGWWGGASSPLAGTGIVRRFLLLLGFALFLPGGIFGFLWVSWFRGSLASLTEAAHSAALTRHRGVDEGFRDWLGGLPAWYHRILGRPAFLGGDPRQAQAAFDRLWRAGWQSSIILRTTDRRTLFSPLVDGSQRMFFANLADILLWRVLQVPLEAPDSIITDLSRTILTSPVFGYHDLPRFTATLFPIEVAGASYLTTWQVRRPDDRGPVAVSLMGQEIRPLQRKFLTDRLPAGVYAWLTGEAAWVPGPPPFPVDAALLAEAAFAQRPARGGGEAASGTVLVTCSPSETLKGVVFASASPLSEATRGERRWWVAFAASGMALLGIVLAISRFLSGLLLTPLAELSRGIAALDRGEVGYRLPDLGGDELGQLARAFNDLMSERADLDVAAEVQRHILPRGVVSVPGYQVAFRAIPLAEVGGDYLDVQRTPDGRLLVTIADVTGHGLSAAMVTMMAKTFVTLEAQENATLLPIIDSLNRQVLQLVQRRKLLTFAGVLIDPVTHRAEWSTAGHPCPFLLDGRGGLQELSIIQAPLGHSTKRPWTSAMLELQAGECLLLYTDGLVETLNPQSEALGYPRLEEFLRSLGGRAPDDLLDEVLAFREAYAAGIPLDDDLTLVAVRREPAAGG